MEFKGRLSLCLCFMMSVNILFLLSKEKKLCMQDKIGEVQIQPPEDCFEKVVVL